MLIISYIMGKYYTLVIKKETRGEKLETKNSDIKRQSVNADSGQEVSEHADTINKIIFNTIQTVMLPPT